MLPRSSKGLRVIILENLQKRYGTREALAGVSLHVRPGELFAYLGPNGAGKSTTIRILSGLARASGGKARLSGFDIESEPLAAKRQCGLVVQHVNVDNDLRRNLNGMKKFWKSSTFQRLCFQKFALTQKSTARLLHSISMAEKFRFLVWLVTNRRLSLDS